MTSRLSLGAVVPWFSGAVLQNNPKFHFSTLGGRHILLLFVGSAGTNEAGVALAAVQRKRALFDDVGACFFGITSDPDDETEHRIAPQMPGMRWFLDYNRAIARRFELLDERGDPIPQWVLIDPMLRVIRAAPIDQAGAVLDILEAELRKPADHGQFAPVLVLPNVFEADFCRRLIALYEANGGEPSGFMREVNGVTTGVQDSNFKRRSDYYLEDPGLREQVRDRISQALAPAIQRSFQFGVTRIERYVVACYDGDSGGFFRPHRDNTTPGTAHRRFACTINLNAEDYEGGDLRFPEFGNRIYRAPTGGAVVFSCSLLHEATPVTRGKRYAYLPFLYDEAGAKQREAYATSANANPALATYRA